MKKYILQMTRKLVSLGVNEGQSAFESRQIRTLNKIALFLGLINVFLCFFNFVTYHYIPFSLNLSILIGISLPIFLFNYFFRYSVAQVYSFFASNTLILTYAYFGISMNRIVNFEVLILACGFFGAFIFDSFWVYIAGFYSIISIILIGAMKVYIGNIIPDSIFIGNNINSIITASLLFGMIWIYKRDFRKSEDRLQLVLKGSNNGWWDWNLIENTIYYSPKWWEAMGYTYNELAPEVQLWWSMLHPSDRKHVNELFERAMTTDLISYEVEFKMHHKLGHYVPILSKGYISRDNNGKPYRISGSNIDLTEHKAIETKLQSLVKDITDKNEELSKQKSEIQSQSEKLADLNKLKDKLFSTIAHDIRSPFTSLLLTLDSLKDELLTEEDLKEILPDITKSASNILVLIDSLFDWARTQLDGTKVHRVQFDLMELIEEELKLFAYRSKEKDVSILNQINENTILYADRNMLQLVVRNLISNALKFCQKGDKIIVTAIPKDNFLEISVTDTGKGISEENLKKIFTAGMASTVGTSGEKGTGLGLILSKEFVNKNGGEIGVESELTKGSRFYFTIPI
ncbi:MAG: PAS domain-containing sensor histidine kinase [Leptospiraceae bacterium]|nr:PAS domain-containing sensor histidine kinase [Leptospiraceae bacterium]